MPAPQRILPTKRPPAPATRRAILALIVGALGVTTTACAAPTPSYAPVSIERWKSNAAPMGWSASENRIFYNSRGRDGLWDAYSARPDGGDPRCLTCATPVLPGAGTRTHRGVSDVSPRGDLMLLEVERGSHFGSIGAPEAEPGRGAYSDVWLARADGSQAWPLTDIYAPGSNAAGTIWARFDRTGTRIVWSELYEPGVDGLGAWRLKTARIAWSGGVPRLADVRTFEPQRHRFYEAYGFSPGDRRILFASDMGMPSWMDAQIWSVDAGFRGPPRRLSPADQPNGFFSNYNEFAFYLPHGDRIIYGRTASSGAGGLDYWVMRADGRDQRRLTFLNAPWSSQWEGYGNVGGLAFDPRDPNRFVAAVSADYTGSRQRAVMVRIGRAG